MDIIKKLSLNKTPKSVENNSIVAAKNIMIDNTGSFITNEPGFSVAFECPNKDEGEYIVGCIPCAKEVVIFTYTPAHNNIAEKSNIYRYYDEGYYSRCDTSWTYSGGKIIGAYTYNYKKELIIAVSEYDAYDSEENPLLVPIKSWNLDANDSVYSYNIEEIIPKFTTNYNVSNTGTLLSGVYTIFIRFKIAEDSYTKWFQITDDIIILNIVDKEGTSHNFMNSGSTTVIPVTLQKFKDFTSTPVDNSNEYTPNIDNSLAFEVNDNDLSSNSIVLSLNFDDSCPFDEYQIGYIYKRNTDVVGRIKSNYKISTNTVEFINNDYIEEISIDELLESPHQFYNVKNIINYNNRLYIANYEEYKNEDLQAYANNIKVQMNYYEEGDSVKSKTQTNIKLDISIGSGEGYTGFTVNNEPISYEIRNNKYYIKNPKRFVKEYIAERFYIQYYRTKAPGIKSCNVANTVSENYINEDGLICNEVKNFSIGVLIAPSQGGQYGQEEIIYSTNNTVSNYDIEIKQIDNIYRLVIHKNNKDFILYTGYGGINILEDREYTVYDGARKYTFEYIFWIFDNEPPQPHYIHPKNVLYVYTTANVESQTIIITTNNKYNNNRTLIPYQIYNFYVHFIRADFSYTDGFPLDATVNNEGNRVRGYEVFNTLTGNKCFKILSPYYKNTNVTQNDIDKFNLIIPSFSFVEGTTIPTGYVGWFITYEEIEKTVIPALVIQHNVDSQKSLNVSSTNFIFNNESVYGNSIVDINDTSHTAQISNASKKIHKKQIREPFIEINSNLEFKDSDIHNDILAFVSDNAAIYSKSTKVLYRLTNNIFENSYTVDEGSYMYLPGFYNKEKIIFYNNDLIISPTASNILNGNGQKIDTYNIYVRLVQSYNNKPTNAYSIYKDYTFGAVSLVDAEGRSKGVYYNKVLSPDSLKDFLELKDCYNLKQDKTYTNYSKTHTDNFSKTIYRSNIVSDESLVNGFREFVYNNYKNILENKGDITNIVGIGLYLIVHTEYSMFVFDRSPKLTQKSQLDIPDAFEIDYQEVMPSNEGFGGLADREESIVTKHGYIWFDKINKYIFVYENGNAKIISQDISNFIKHLNINTVRFGEDIINNRLLICIYLNSFQTINNALVQDSITLSYSFVTNTFISLHDYTFTDNFRTYNQSYIFDKNKDNTCLYVFDKYSYSYKDLLNKTYIYYKAYFTEQNVESVNDSQNYDVNIESSLARENNVIQFYDDITEIENNEDSGSELSNMSDVEDDSGSEINVEVDTNASNNDDTLNLVTATSEQTTNVIQERRAKNYIDIIFNESYDITKVLNYISYILSEINSEFDAINVSEEYLNRRFSGNELEIYTDECYTGVLDIEQQEIINKLEEIKIPHWQNGSWNLNYFRNNITTPVDEAEINTLTTIPYYNNNTKQTENVTINIERLKKALHYDETTDRADISDNRSLIYGKYFVVRFIFNNDKRIKFDEISFNVNKY